LAEFERGLSRKHDLLHFARLKGEQSFLTSLYPLVLVRFIGDVLQFGKFHCRAIGVAGNATEYFADCVDFCGSLVARFKPEVAGEGESSLFKGYLDKGENKGE